MPGDDDTVDIEIQPELYDKFEQIKLENRPDLPEIMDAVMGVGRESTIVYFTLLRNQGVPVKELSDLIDYSDSWIREKLALLEAHGLVEVDKRVGKEGKHFAYYPLPLEDTKRVLLDALDFFDIHVNSRIDGLRDDPEEMELQFRSAASRSSSESAEVQSVNVRHILDGRSISFRTIATSVFGISHPELLAYFALLDNPRSSAADLGEIQNLSRGTVTTRLNKLQERGLAYPLARPTSGSPAYEYVPRPFDEVQSVMHEELDEWVDHADQIIRDFDQSSASLSQ